MPDPVEEWPASETVKKQTLTKCPRCDTWSAADRCPQCGAHRMSAEIDVESEEETEDSEHS